MTARAAKAPAPMAFLHAVDDVVTAELAARERRGPGIHQASVLALTPEQVRALEQPQAAAKLVSVRRMRRRPTPGPGGSDEG